MHYTLHLTNECNMACSYCYVGKQKIVAMSVETARKAADLAGLPGKPVGLVFFGGEPLLQKDLIYSTVEYCRWKEKHSDCCFYFKVTTNGLLLDRDFMEFSKKEDIFIALSHDGVQEAHDRHRFDKRGEGTFDSLTEKIDLLLASRPYAPVLLVFNPDTAAYYCDSVKYLYERGFKYIICSMNHAANWDRNAFRLLKREYEKLSEFYYEKTLAEDKFYLSPFEVKISSQIQGDDYCKERCELGKRQISIAPDGFLYPCVQFVGDAEFAIGHIDSGIDETVRDRLYSLNEMDKRECVGCAISSRCNNHCGCMNRQATGRIERVSPALCEHERLLLPIADRLAEKLYRKRNAMFVQKHYNDMFPVLSLIEDNTELP